VELLNVPPKQYLSPRLSPDGQTLVVQSVEDSEDVLWIYDLTGDRAIQQLTFEGNNNRPVWTPDSQRISFSSDRDGTMSLYWVPADGSGVSERLTTAEEGTSHWMGSWSPDGELLVFNVLNEPQTDRDIWTLSVDDREIQSLYDTPGAMYMGTELSPNGEWLAYGAGPTPQEVDIYVEPFPPTGARRRISQNFGYWPLWSPGGNELFYRPGADTGDITLRSVDIVTEPAFSFSNEQTLPIEGFNVTRGYRDYDMSPDGERLLMVFPADQADPGEPARDQINIVLNWFEELKERVPVP
jgi:Tol biopolymer transport system component